ncbi:Glucose/arabinose dehydrogenase, beta-propeller fold [Sanguibacter gelidistatuariae]|uniref:Glucose/arabinose dehydrogenase, beta-propeller fold n=2 Tax=Sanguibacter gelidistatuariae TaxID=1814289 RepID=A0A1G6Q940_9MICO|nr:Glucose/arabinose dehydrogenase, beta-propeller fold [Sanguibacter gelidistatuariae]
MVAVCALAACSNDDDAAPAATSTAATSTSAEPEPEPSASAPAGSDVPAVPEVTVTVTGAVATGLAAPWGLAQLPDGAWLVTQRDDHAVLIVRPGGAPTPVSGTGADDLRDRTVGDGEAGLLGVAVSPTFAEDHLVFVYRTGESGNEVLRGELDGARLGPLTTIVSDIPAAGNHNGGQLAFGPDGYLYISTGDAGDSRHAQDPDSLAGKILRVTADGKVPAGNPVPGSPVWSLGHRNVQGLGWSADGRMFASEFGQDTFDELNLIVAGGNYGWPDVEGTGGEADGFIDPLVTWPTSDASPSGLAVTDEGVYLAGLRGERLWRLPLADRGVGEPQELLAGEYGRLRAVVASQDGSLAVLTNNTDGRGTPREGDDQLLLLAVAPAS